MRTTLDLEDDVYLYAREQAARERVSIGRVVSQLMRMGVTGAQGAGAAGAGTAAQPAEDGLRFVNGIPVIQSPPESLRVVSQALIDRIREDEGV
jgi:hypothetical protein